MINSLKEYKKKRDFHISPEPSGKKPRKSEKPLFVIQKHAARTLHYDVRLEIDNVLKSWAVPKGPSTNPKEKRLAMPTEDHPLDYADFEGVIPKDQYGGGTVLVWDKGSYRNLREELPGDGADMNESYKQGKIKVWLDGEKLQGGYAFIRTKAKNKQSPQWLLIKEDDQRADARRNPVNTEPDSVLTGRSLEDIKKQSENKTKDV